MRGDKGRGQPAPGAGSESHQLRRLDPPSPKIRRPRGPSAASAWPWGGAKNHAVLMPDADLDNAVSALMGAAYGSCGERHGRSRWRCVGDQVADALIAKLIPQIKAL